MGVKGKGCSCQGGKCSTCACGKSNTHCIPGVCHGGFPSPYCLNCHEGDRVKALGGSKELKKACIALGLSPIGNKSDLMLRLLAQFQKDGKRKKDRAQTKDGAPTSASVDDADSLIAAILEAGSDYAAVLCLSSMSITENSTSKDMRKAYLKLSRKVHPDKNRGNGDAKAAFQALVVAFDRLSQPDLFADEEAGGLGGDARRKANAKAREQVVRGNGGCYKTYIGCPRCHMEWGKKELGLEDAAYNFFMSGLKQYVCGRCACLFGCMTATHKCPRCRKPFEYDANDYHRKVTCGNKGCTTPFGFYYFKVSKRRYADVRREVKEEHERRAKKAAAQKRRRARASVRTHSAPVAASEQQQQDNLFIRGLLDACPRCGVHASIIANGQRFKSELAKEHLKGCTDKKAQAMYRKKQAEAKARKLEAESMQAREADLLAEKQWEFNGRQIGQLWMLSESSLHRKCLEFSLCAQNELQNMPKQQVISLLSQHLRKISRLMLEDAKSPAGSSSSAVRYDTSGIHAVDESDLPMNMWSMEREELKCVCASYSVNFAADDSKETLISRLERSRHKGSQFMLADEVVSTKPAKDASWAPDGDGAKDISSDSDKKGKRLRQGGIKLNGSSEGGSNGIAAASPHRASKKRRIVTIVDSDDDDDDVDVINIM